MGKKKEQRRRKRRRKKWHPFQVRWCLCLIPAFKRLRKKGLKSSSLSWTIA